jgi:hypothetical protein
MRCNPEATPPWEPIAAALNRAAGVDWSRRWARAGEEVSMGEAAHLGWVMAHPARARRRVPPIYL